MTASGVSKSDNGAMLKNRFIQFAIIVMAVCTLVDCGGGGSGSSPVTTGGRGPGGSGNQGGEGSGAGWVKDVFQPASNFRAMCESPRVGNFPDVQGIVTDENNWLRSISNDLYLWYSEIVDVDPGTIDDPLEYFDLMRTFELTPSGNFKDRFHFTIDTEEWEQLSQSGIAVGYGVTFVLISRTPPREVLVAYTEPDSPATSATVNLVRGEEILEIDGVDVENSSDVDTLNLGLFPSTSGERHTFVIRNPDSEETRTVTLVSQEVRSTPVQNIGAIDTATGKVGYILFNDHIATAERQLIDAVNFLKEEGISDLVLDMRYNGGGFLDIANELAYMIAGQTAEGQVFDELQFNDKHVIFNPVTGAALSPTLFHTTAQGFSVDERTPLPVLNLPRVYVLTGGGTCSASEAVMNGLAGIGVDVIQIGSNTCGKPYGFYSLDNCGTTYFTVQFRSINASGFGDYSDGFSPTSDTDAVAGALLRGCSVEDDFTRPLGDTAEARLSNALYYRENNSCQESMPESSLSTVNQIKGEVVKPVWLNNMTASP